MLKQKEFLKYYNLWHNFFKKCGLLGSCATIIIFLENLKKEY